MKTRIFILLSLLLFHSCKDYEEATEVNFGFSSSLLYSSMVTLSSALDSAGATAFTSLPTFSPTVDDPDLIVSREDNVNCNSSGDKTGHPSYTANHDNTTKYVFHDAYCHLRKASRGPDRLQGAVDRIKGYLCALTDFIKEDGVQRSGVLIVDTSCFNSVFVENVQDSLGTNRLNVNVISYNNVPSSFGNTSYNKALYVYMSDIDKTYKIIYTLTSSALYAAVQDDTNMTFAIALEFGSAGAIRYESRSYNPNGYNGVQHIRVLAQGNVGTDGSFSDITNFQFLLWEEYGTQSGGAKFQSVSGNPTDGYNTQYSYTGTGTDVYDHSIYTTSSTCYFGACTGNTGIQLDDAGDVAFLSSVNPTKAGSTEIATWFYENGPMTFTSVTTSANP
jgi:hypothetical protein